MKTFRTRRLPAALAAAFLAASGTALAHPGLNPAATIAELEQEKQTDNIYKAWFPSLDLARRAAISFHAQLLESHYEAGYLVLELDNDEMDRLRSFGFRLERATDFIQRRNQRLTWLQIQQSRGLPADGSVPAAIPGYSCYETVEETFAAGDGLIAAQPGLASWVLAGSSWLKVQNPAQGYDIRVLKLTNSVVQGDKPKLFIHAAMHAREYVTAPLALEFARWLVNGHGSHADATWILDHHEVHIMLHANPDGRKRAETGLSWRKNVNNNHCANTNTRGVDLNRNFSFGWNSTGGQGSSGSACSLTYRGPSAGSEPETKAIQDYARSLWPDRRGPSASDPAPADTSGIHIDLHSFSELVLWPWGNTATPAPNGTALQTLGRRLAWFNGYQPTQSIGLYPTDGTSDGVSYGELGVAAFTFELGTSFFQSCTVYNNTIKPNNLPALIYAAKVVRTPYITPAGPDITELSLGGGAQTQGVAAGTPVAVQALATDTRFSTRNGTEPTQAIAQAHYSIGTPPWDPAARLMPLAAADGSFNSATEALAGSIKTSGLPVGQHLVYVQARDADGVWGPVTAAFLKIVAQAPLPVSETEPNDSPAQAQALGALPLAVSGTLELGGDVDVFRFILAPEARLVARLQAGPGAALKLELLNPAGRSMRQVQVAAGQAAELRYHNKGNFGAPFLLRVSRGSGDPGTAAGAYTLVLSD